VLLSPARTLAAGRITEVARVVPLEQVPLQHREMVGEIIREHTLSRKAPADSFPCHPSLYLTLLEEPMIPLALWQDLAASPVRLERLAPGRYSGTDGAGANATWEFIVRTPKLHVLLCRLDYSSPRGAAKLQGRIVLIVRSGFYKEVNGDPFVQHDVEAFVKVDSRGWKALARTVRPILESVLEDQVQEAGLFVSLMGRLVETYPEWACSVVSANTRIPAESREQFRNVVLQNRRKGASSSRPVVLDDAKTQTRRR
jgi:hypothetical protein